MSALSARDMPRTSETAAPASSAPGTQGSVGRFIRENRYLHQLGVLALDRQEHLAGNVDGQQCAVLPLGFQFLRHILHPAIKVCHLLVTVPKAQGGAHDEDSSQLSGDLICHQHL